MLKVFIIFLNSEFLSKDIFKIDNSFSSAQVVENIYYLEDLDSKLSFVDIINSNKLKKLSQDFVKFKRGSLWTDLTIQKKI